MGLILILQHIYSSVIHLTSVELLLLVPVKLKNFIWFNHAAKSH